MSWPLVALGDVCSINPRLPKNIDEEQEVTFLGMASVSENGYLLNQEKRILKETKKGFTYFEKDDILVAKITPCFENGKAVFLDQLESEIGFGSTEFHVLRPDSQLDGKYLFYIIWNPYFRFVAEKNMTGSAGQKRVPTDFFKNFKIPLPPLEEQKRIAAILDKADAIRQKRQQAIELADEFLRSVFLDMFGDPVTNPKGWKTAPIDSVSQVVTGNTPPRSEKDNYGSYIEWIKSDNINTPNHYLTKAEEYLSLKGLDKGRMVPAGSILITCIAGSPQCIGNVAITNRSVAFNQQINALIPSNMITTQYIYSLVLFGKKLIQSISTNSMKGMVSKGNLEKLCIPIPPIELQNKYSLIFKSLEEKINLLSISKNYGDDLFSSIQKKAFSGKL